MDFNWAGAAGGLLGAVGTEANAYAQRERDMKQRQAEQAIADRKEKAQLVVEAARMKYQYDALGQQGTIAREQMANQEKLNTADNTARSSDLDKQLAAQKSLAEARTGGGGENVPKLQQTLEIIQNSPYLSDEQKKEAINVAVGITKKGGEGPSESQLNKAGEEMAKLKGEGITTETVDLYNFWAGVRGEPKMKKVESVPAKDGFFSDTDAEYKFIEDPASVKGEKKTEGKPSEKTDELDQYRKELTGETQKATPSKPMASQGIAAPEPTSTDIGSVLGVIVNGGVGAVKKLAEGGQDLMALDRQITSDLKNASGESKSALLKALAAVRQVMATDTNPESELRSRAIAPTR